MTDARALHVAFAIDRARKRLERRVAAMLVHVQGQPPAFQSSLDSVWRSHRATDAEFGRLGDLVDEADALLNRLRRLA